MIGENLTLATVTGAVIYSVSGTLLTLVNKIAIRIFPQACLLIIIQNGMTIVLLLLTMTFYSHAFGSVPEFSSTLMVRWAPLSCLFVTMLVSSLLALMHISAVSLVVLRNLTTLIVAVGERVFLGTRLSWSAIGALWGMLLGAVLYGLSDLAFDATGYAWLFVNIAASSSYQVYVKALARDDALSPLGMSYISNIISLPLLGFGSLILGEISSKESAAQILSAISGASTAAVVLLSGMLGYLLSTSAFLLNKLISATSIMVINNATKFSVILLSEVFMERSLGLVSGSGTFLVLLFAYVYSNCPKAQKTDKICQGKDSQHTNESNPAVVQLKTVEQPKHSSQKSERPVAQNSM
jgi:GDP-mannose transporter